MRNINFNITHQRKLRKWSKERLAREANLSLSLINRLEAGDANPTIESVRKLAKAFNLSLVEFVRRQQWAQNNY